MSKELEKQLSKVESAARALAEGMGDNYDHAFENKADWTSARGMRGGRFRDINEPFRSDYREGAGRVIKAIRGPDDAMIEGAGEQMSYPNEIQRFYCEDLKWCFCGNQAGALEFMRDCLRALHDYSNASRKGDNVAAERARERVQLLLPSDSMLALSYRYMIDALGLTEHGGSVYRLWLTDRGKDVLRLLSDNDIESAMDELN